MQGLIRMQYKNYKLRKAQTTCNVHTAEESYDKLRPNEI